MAGCDAGILKSVLRNARDFRRAVSRRTRRNGGLSEERIVRAALAIINRSGTEALTMRALADELGVSPMAAYYYVESKDDLLRLVGDSLLAQVEVPPEDGGTWDERLRKLLHDQRNALKRHPGLREAIIGRLDLEERRRLEDAEFDLLLEAGLEPVQAVMAFRTLQDWCLGNALVESKLRDPKERRPPEKHSKVQRATLDRRLMPRLSADDYFELELDNVVSGVRATLEASRRSPKSRRRQG
jgi:AcrR family transcriptional regulator